MAQTVPAEFSDIKYQSYGACSSNNLSFNTARFTKINLGFKRDNLDIYLQILLFINDDGIVRVRTQEMGLVECKNDSQNGGEICSFKPYSSTKKLFESKWSYEQNRLVIEGVGSITKIRDDFPWLGFELTIASDFHMKWPGKLKSLVERYKLISISSTRIRPEFAFQTKDQLVQ